MCHKKLDAVDNCALYSRLYVVFFLLSNESTHKHTAPRSQAGGIQLEKKVHIGFAIDKLHEKSDGEKKMSTKAEDNANSKYYENK